MGATTANAADSIYWADQGGGSIQVANLDGSGTASTLFGGEGSSGPCGVAIDPAAGKIYWANFSGNIRVGNLDGSGTASTLFGSEGGPCGVAIDPAAGKIYWATYTSSTIRVGNLDGSGSPTTLFSESNPTGVTIDPAAGKIYWVNQQSADSVRVANLDGSGTASTLFSGEAQPAGVAIDPAAGKIYWTVFTGTAIRVGNLDGTGASLLFSDSGGPNLPALLRAPAGTGVPTISGGGGVGDQLTCSQGDWAPDLLGAFLFRAPHSFAYQWQENGTDINGATDATYTPTEPGSYTCRVTAENQAGSASQTSDPKLGGEPVRPTRTVTTATPATAAKPATIRR